ncbi:nucleoside kinase [Agrobacterium tumefaciens]|uniref:Nucleoside kinase n=1 Tax=Agrobacterium tumefaciens TaxID=358 RepID=A0AAE6BMX5_AGRTU|nr:MULTISPECIES: nucleoside kinase [Agrobacterium]MCD4661525.1 nucleoside kinase [Agrobacterium sp.]QCM01404.1 nucleoside kinase [Agrobacterium tumefaciens]
MGVRNYLIEGVSGVGKTSVATELQRRGYHVIHGDRELAYKGDPETGEPVDLALFQGGGDIAFRHRRHIWDVEKVQELATDRTHAITFFCGGSRNFQHFIDVFDEVFVLDVDGATLQKRLAARPADEFGGNPAEREFVLQLHATKEDLPVHATVVSSSRPLDVVVDDILARCTGPAAKGSMRASSSSF